MNIYKNYIFCGSAAIQIYNAQLIYRTVGAMPLTIEEFVTHPIKYIISIKQSQWH